jgi:hypothetical protein
MWWCAAAIVRAGCAQVDAMLNYVYTLGGDDHPAWCDSALVEQLYRLAHRYEIAALLKSASQRLCELSDAQRFCDVITHADRHR